MNEKREIMIWCPFTGKVGTEVAMKNYAKALEVNERTSVTFVSVVGEWDHLKDEFAVLSLPVNVLIKKIILLPSARGRLLTIYSFFIAFILSVKFRSHKIEVVTGLNAIPILIFFKIFSPKTKLHISIQGFPKFFLGTGQNFYYKFENWVRKLLWRKIYKHATNLICMTDGTQKKIVEEFKFGQAITVPNPLFRDITSKHSYELKSKLQVVFVGRLSFQKDVDLFCKTAALFSNTPEIEFRIFGEGELFDSAKQKYAHCNLHFMGYVSSPWDKLIGKRVVHLVTSYWEDPGHAMLESLARQIPTIVVRRESPHCELGYNYGGLQCGSSDKEIAETIGEVENNYCKYSQLVNHTAVQLDFSEDKFTRKLAGVLLD